MRPPSTTLVLDAIAPATWTLLAGAVISAVLGAVSVLWPGALMLDAGSWLAVLAGSAVANLAIVLPAAGGVGVVAALGRWGDEGSWPGLMASGTRGRDLAAGALTVGMLVAVPSAVLSNAVEPMARAALHRAQWSATAETRLWPGRTVDFGSIALQPRSSSAGFADDLFIAVGGAVGSAARGRLLQGPDGPLLELEDVVLMGAADRSWRLTAASWRVPLPDVRGRRVAVQERSNTELARAAWRTEHEEKKDPSYEWAQLYKRWLHPLAVLLFPLAVLPLGVRRGRGPWLGAAGVGYLVAVRGGDHLAKTLGAWPGAAFGLGFVVLVGAVLWASWRDR